MLSRGAQAGQVPFQALDAHQVLEAPDDLVVPAAQLADGGDDALAPGHGSRQVLADKVPQLLALARAVQLLELLGVHLGEEVEGLDYVLDVLREVPRRRARALHDRVRAREESVQGVGLEHLRPLLLAVLVDPVGLLLVLLLLGLGLACSIGALTTAALHYLRLEPHDLLLELANHRILWILVDHWLVLNALCTVGVTQS
mmetsp:Transcript_64749/g.150544  ORF Transcript_64749/g.150544 Transcript_64749/m.150544 type:complete len:200 (-) Transcript_64749:1154-1753(-)